MLTTQDLNRPHDRSARYAQANESDAEKRLREAREEIARRKEERERLSPAAIRALEAEVEAEEKAKADRVESADTALAAAEVAYIEARDAAQAAADAAFAAVSEAVLARARLNQAHGRAMRLDIARPRPAAGTMPRRLEGAHRVSLVHVLQADW